MYTSQKELCSLNLTGPQFYPYKLRGQFAHLTLRSFLQLFQMYAGAAEQQQDMQNILEQFIFQNDMCHLTIQSTSLMEEIMSTLPR
jgi:hypothetical protein